MVALTSFPDLIDIDQRNLRAKNIAAINYGRIILIAL